MTSPATSRYMRKLREGERVCWRGDKINLCGEKAVGEAGLCEVHRAEMRSWS